ncbi:MAG: nickel-responsive transcriptional regulator NikR [Planctomycetes bacterium]|nr:nickel-responsive transcriptional regulator NikR [Planctomycetota bacterium]MCA8936502.1 nickel-responsive transcriptional regulator NikR [Planctomycetota bacterium]MCA8944840.1 nickel-responsive transcriptional regulator NikR [Planctomycetota bacterium]
MSDLVRLSISLESDLAAELDRLVERSRYENRSEYVRDLIRAQLVDEEWQEGHEVLGTITLIYDHHQNGLSDKLNTLQHEHHASVLASTHVHLDHHLCAEMIMLRGLPDILRGLTDDMRKLKGVLHAALAFSSTGHSLRKPGKHSHAHS